MFNKPDSLQKLLTGLAQLSVHYSS